MEFLDHRGKLVAASDYGDRGKYVALVRDMDEKVREQAVNVAKLPGIVRASCVMPDGHWGYGFPIGGVAAFDAEQGGVVSAGGVGFDVSCGVRCLLTGLRREEVMAVQRRLAQEERALVERVIQETGSATAAAARLGISRVGLYKILRKGGPVT